MNVDFEAFALDADEDWHATKNIISVSLLDEDFEFNSSELATIGIVAK